LHFLQSFIVFSLYGDPIEPRIKARWGPTMANRYRISQTRCLWYLESPRIEILCPTRRTEPSHGLPITTNSGLCLPTTHTL
jgi:hypothetical protein